MKLDSPIFRRLLASVLLISFAVSMTPAKALDSQTLTEDLDALVLEGNDLVSAVTLTNLTTFKLDSQLAALEASVDNYAANVSTVYDSVASASGTLTLDSEVLLSLQTLATVSASLAQQVVVLSNEVVALAPLTLLTSLEASLYSMLRLSDDIGTMSNRILEMADKILVMADNIGLMADRILATQLIQNSNIELVVAATMQTQQNTLTLFSMFL
jgi:hypothetical protein